MGESEKRAIAARTPTSHKPFFFLLPSSRPSFPPHTHPHVMGAGAAGDALHALVGAAAFVRANPRSDRFKV